MLEFLTVGGIREWSNSGRIREQFSWSCQSLWLNFHPYNSSVFVLSCFPRSAQPQKFSQSPRFWPSLIWGTQFWKPTRVQSNFQWHILPNYSGMTFSINHCLFQACLITYSSWWVVINWIGFSHIGINWLIISIWLWKEILHFFHTTIRWREMTTERE